MGLRGDGVPHRLYVMTDLQMENTLQRNCFPSTGTKAGVFHPHPDTSHTHTHTLTPET